MSQAADHEVRDMVVVQLDAAKARGDLITPQLIRAKIDAVAGFMESQDPSRVVDREALLRDLEADYNVHVASWNTLVDDGDHVAWLPQRQDEIRWRFWDRYKRYMRNVKRMPTASIDRLDEITWDVLARIEDPTRPGRWDRRGLVAGQVQSGKTANYIGLICKAVDAGYKLIVVLAGVHNSLRSQTQARIDEGVLGFDTRHGLRFDRVDSRIGVGRLAGPYLHVHSFTSSRENGDFSISVAANIGVAVGGHDPVVLVVKKNKRILTNLHEWATKLRQEFDPGTGRPVVPDVPVLLIDDEADHASIDTNGRRGAPPDDHDPTVINKLIRRFLHTFEQTAYVGYTATPFANIFINPDAEHPEAGEDIFPRSFIVNLPAPSTYAGPAQVFGLREDPSGTAEAVRALPIVRTIHDHQRWMPDGHKAHHVPTGPLPGTLRNALRMFLLAGAVRAHRGRSGRHHSMLVHVTRYTAVQRIVAEQIRDEMDDLKRRLLFGDGAAPDLHAELGTLYRTELLANEPELATFDELQDQFGPLPPYAELTKHLENTATTAVVWTINGTSKDALQYIDHPEGLNVVAIGGDKLSRGLTLEGLSVSYYLRASKMYDTLMQMGRWFGYRPGYLDVCRLYTTPELAKWFTAVTAASEELVREFDYMAATGSTPREFGLRVRQHPDGLLVTAPSKLRHARQVSISFSGQVSESIIFKTDQRSRERNWTALQILVERVEQSSARMVQGRERGSLLWTDVPAELVMEFLSTYESHPDALKAQPNALRDYISSRVHDTPPELTDWWLLVAGNPTAASGRELNDRTIGLIERAQYPKTDGADPDTARYSIRRVVSPADERIDFDDTSAEWRAALDETRRAWAASTRKGKSDKEPTVPSGVSLRARRPASRGLLILYPLDPASHDPGRRDAVPYVGFAVSFPHSPRAKPITYQVNVTYLQQEFGIDDEDDEDE